MTDESRENSRSARDYKPYLMDMVIEEYNDERVQNIAKIHYNIILGKFLSLPRSYDSVWSGEILRWINSPF